jgi:hypothetical protein
MNNESLPGFTPNYQVLGSVELTSQQAYLINKYAPAILNGTFDQAKGTFQIIFDRPPQDDTEMQIFAGFCEMVVNGEKLEGRPMTWDDIPPERRPQ